MSRPPIDILGQVFCDLTVVEFSHLKYHDGAYWKCLCSCGKVVTVRASSLRSGHTTGCGHNVGTPKTHGDTGTRFYKTWAGLTERCDNIRSTAYKHYGARGITICSDWRSYEQFKIDMWSSYITASLEFGESNITIDRINPDVGYNKQNCRWLTRSENTRTAHAFRKEQRCVNSRTG